MIAIIDYQAGNGESVLNALRKMNYSAIITSRKEELEKSHLIILPGVGSAQATMDNLTQLGLITHLNQMVMVDKKPFIGICIGYQILFEESQESDTNQNVKTLGWTKGVVKKFNSNRVKVPQIGWGLVQFKRSAKPFLNGLAEKNYFYYVNSYYGIPGKEELLATTIYDLEFGAIFRKGNILATQFHLEKSGEVGLTLFQNILDFYLKK